MNRSPKIIPIILCGGAGARLWPVSRAKTPKQFQNIMGGVTLFQQALTRCQASIFDDKPIVVCGHDGIAFVSNILSELNMKADVLIEPMSKNSCPAVLAAVLQALIRDPQALVLVVAADHLIEDKSAFQKSVSLAVGAALEGSIVTFGVKPSYAATGYGYILPSRSAETFAVVPVAKFVEKPNFDTAQKYVAEGFLWNSGNFLFQAHIFVEEVREFAPTLSVAVTKAFNDAHRDKDLISLTATAFVEAPTISIDVAVIEKTKHAAVLPVTYQWQDIGTWDAVAATLVSDENNNAISGPGKVVAGRNVVIQSEGILTTVVGCEDLIVVTTADAVLIVKRGASEQVKELTEQLRTEAYDKYL